MTPFASIDDSGSTLVSGPGCTRIQGLLYLLALPALVACAGGGTPGEDGSPGAGDPVWESLLEPRPTPLEGAPRVTVSDLLVLTGHQWGLEGTSVSPALALSELVSAGLLRRRDIRFVERRRFAREAERVRMGLPRPPGAPPVGRSPGAELVLAGAWAQADSASGALDLRLTVTETGEVIRSWRVEAPLDADPTSLARAATGSLLAALRAMDRLPGWNDPLVGEGVVVAPAEYRSTGIPVEAVAGFARGLAAEDRWAWSRALEAYRSARRIGGEAFYEVDAALARLARLRAGGTLGASD